MASLPFTESTKSVFAKSRQIALDLGCDYISTLHFFLADCQLHPLSSPKGLFFDNHGSFQKFYDTSRVGAPNNAMGSVPLLKEAEKTLRHARQVCKSYRDEAIHPCHLFVASSQLPGSPILNLLTLAKFMPEDLTNFYIRSGQLKSLPTASDLPQSFLSRWWQQLREHRA